MDTALFQSVLEGKIKASLLQMQRHYNLTLQQAGKGMKNLVDTIVEEISKEVRRDE